MNFKTIGAAFGILLLLVLIGGIGYRVVAPTSKTVVGQGGKVVNISTETPKVPLGGCAIWRLNTKLYWEKGFKLQDQPEVKK